MKIQKLILGPFQTNTYLVSCEHTRQALVIDPAEENNGLIDSIQKQNLALKYILITHGHLDHIGGVAWLQKQTEAPVLMHADDLPIVESSPNFARMLGLRASKHFKPDEFVTEKTIIEAGLVRLRILHTPGHSPGSICLVGDYAAFVGDTLFARSIGRTDLPGGDYEQIVVSIRQKLFTLNAATEVYPGHGPNTMIGIEKVNNPFFS